jgi:hypothetical protein
MGFDFEKQLKAQKEAFEDWDEADDKPSFLGDTLKLIVGMIVWMMFIIPMTFTIFAKLVL